MANLAKIAALAGGLLTVAAAASAQLPVHDSGILLQAMSNQPSYGSELRRGAKAGLGCNSFDTPDRQLKRCYDDAMHINIISNVQDEKPFELGIYIDAFIFELIKLDSKIDIDVREHADIKENVQFYFVEYVTIRKEFGLTDEQVTAALGLNSSVTADLRRYENYPELLAPHWKEP